MRRSFASLNAPLDPRPDSTHISQLNLLQVREFDLFIPLLSSKDVKGLKLDSDLTVLEVDYIHANKASAFFTVGDSILKISGEPALDEQQLKRVLTTRNSVILLSRRLFACVPEEGRIQTALHTLRLPLQRGYCYQVIECQKSDNDKLIGSAFGFVIDTITVHKSTKYIVVDVTSNSAAERYFSVGDALLDSGGVPLKPGNLKAVRKFNSVFQKGGVLEILIERPVTEEARKDTEKLIQAHLDKHNTPAMSQDVVKIAVDAAHMHQNFWSRVVPESIHFVRPKSPMKSPKKTSKKKKENDNQNADVVEKIETTQDQSEEPPRISISSVQSYEKITTDVSDVNALEPVGYRYTDSKGQDEDGNESDGDDYGVVDGDERDKKKSGTNKIKGTNTKDRKSDTKMGKKGSNALKESAMKWLELFRKKK